MNEMQEGFTVERSPQAEHEMVLIKHHLGMPLANLKNLDPDEASRIMRDACLFALLTMEEIAAKDRFAQRIHGQV